MKTWQGVVLFFLFLAFMWVLMWTMRVFSNSVTTVLVEEVRQGVECAKMVTADGAAIDCWFTEGLE